MVAGHHDAENSRTKSSTVPGELDRGGPEPPFPPAAYSWYVVGVLMVVYVFSFMDRQILGLLVGPIKRDLDISDTQFSYLMGLSFAVFYTFFGIPIGRLADSISRRGLIACGLVLVELDDRRLRSGESLFAFSAVADGGWRRRGQPFARGLFDDQRFLSATPTRHGD